MFRTLLNRFFAPAPPEDELPRPRLADGVELLGEYQGSGLKAPPCLVRRSDGRVLQLTRLAYVVATLSDGSRDAAGIAVAVERDTAVRLTADQVMYLVTEKLAPAGLIAGSEEGPPRLPAAAAPLALRVRAAVVPAAAVRVAAAVFAPLFLPLFVGAALAWLVVLDVWLFGRHGVARAVDEVVARPVLLLVVFGLVVLGTVVHECGHAAACRYGGGRPGAMGVGLYLVWPVLYTDVTDAYRLDRRGRLRTDLGGVYFNVLFALAATGAYAGTRFEPLLVVVALQHLQILQQLVPWGRLDGYYVLSDLTGVPDILSRLRPTLASLVPGRPLHPRVAELKTWVRVVVTVYVLTLVPFLAVVYALLLVHAPDFAAAALRVGTAQVHVARQAIAAGDLATVALAIVQIAALVLPLVGTTLLALGLFRAGARAGWGLVAPRPRLLTAAAFAAGAAVALLGAGWWSAVAVTSDGAPAHRRATRHASTAAASRRGRVRRRPRRKIVAVAPAPAPAAVPHERRSTGRQIAPRKRPAPAARTISPTPPPDDHAATTTSAPTATDATTTNEATATTPTTTATSSSTTTTTTTAAATTTTTSGTTP